MGALPFLALWLLVLVVASFFFRRRKRGYEAPLAIVLQVVLPGVGYAYLHAWAHMLIAFSLGLFGGGFVFSLFTQFIGIPSMYSYFAPLFWVAIIIDAALVADANRRAVLGPLPPRKAGPPPR